MNHFRWIIIFAIVLCCQNLSAQKDKSTLQSEYKQLMNEINNIERTIRNTKQQQQKKLMRMQSISDKIKKRNGLINNISTQISSTDQDILETADIIAGLEYDLKKLKEEYAEILVQSYKNIAVANELSFLFSAQNFNDAWQRLLFLKRYADFRKEQSVLIDKTMVSLNQKVFELEQLKAGKVSLIKDEEAQKRRLKEERAAEKRLLAKLSDSEKALKRKIDNKNQAAKRVNNAIQKIIEEEIRLAREKAMKANPKAEKLGLTPEEQALASNFVSNRGKLPWPVKVGRIIEKFGKHRHPNLPVYIYNNGIDIKTNPLETVRASFNGTVVKVFSIPGNFNSVIVKHGSYFTVYSFLAEVFVTAGQKVETRQNIGAAAKDDQENISKMHFEVWKGMEKLNPELWIAKVK